MLLDNGCGLQTDVSKQMPSLPVCEVCEGQHVWTLQECWPIAELWPV